MLSRVVKVHESAILNVRVAKTEQVVFDVYCPIYLHGTQIMGSLGRPMFLCFTIQR